MSIWNALGLAAFIIVLKLLAPAVLSQGESTVRSFLHGAQVSADVAASYAAFAAQSRTPALPPFPLPHAPQITAY